MPSCNNCIYGEARHNKNDTYRDFYCHCFGEPIDYPRAVDEDLRCDFYEQELDDNKTEESNA